MGNIRARQRIEQYTLKGLTRGLVKGLFGRRSPSGVLQTNIDDGAADLLPLVGLTKPRVRVTAE
uniref:Uncharacterized protein n=1 Tax=Agrobacterium genomosp. 6 TaxID=1183411 RepID=A0A2Z2PD99_9HYPH|nr:hypothetical protein [Agrobacterium genomosp. 6]ASK41506.1 hypothetical protein [Agrobacterium genomosp. 6]